MTEPSTALDRVVAHSPAELLPSDDEIRRMYRIAESLHLSGAWKDVGRAEVAFAKMIIGRDLGLTPAQAMQGIHIVEGGVQMHYATLGQFVRSRDGYDFRAGWLKQVPGEADAVFVWHDEEDPTDEREVVGAAVVFTVDGAQRGLSRYTVDDADKAGLIKRDKPRAAWNAARRNMLLARAMSNGVKWFVPEVMGGMPVYVEGELPEKASLTAGTGTDDDSGEGIDLGPDVEKIIERATTLGHRGLSNRASLEIALGGRAPGLVKEWVARAKEELDRFAAGKATAEAAMPGEDVPDAEESTPEPVEEVDAEPVAEADPRDAVAEHVQSEGGEVQS